VRSSSTMPEHMHTHVPLVAEAFRPADSWVPPLSPGVHLSPWVSLKGQVPLAPSGGNPVCLEPCPPAHELK